MIKRKMMVVAGGPVVRALCFYCREHGFAPLLWGNKHSKDS